MNWRFFIYGLIAVFTTASLSYVQTTDPEALEDLLVRIDVFGISTVAAEENVRIEQIRALSIPYEKKKVLMERTIFMGATRQMVVLALGQPREASAISAPSKNITERWVYFFKDEQRPTVLEFEKDMLSSAYKGSALDIQ